MKINLQSFENIIGIFWSSEDRQLMSLNIKKLPRKYLAVEVVVTAHVINENLDANLVKFLPFDPHYKNSLSGKKGLYKKINGSIDKLFGMFISVLVFILYALINPENLASAQSLISLLGAYFIAKDFWSDIESGLVFLTQKFRLKLLDKPYMFIKSDEGSVKKFLDAGEILKYGKRFILPNKFDFTQDNDSKELKLLFSKHTLAESREKDPIILETSLGRDDLDVITTYEIQLIKPISIFQKNIQISQCVHNEKLYAADVDGNLMENSVAVRETFSLGRLDYFQKSYILEGIKLIEFQKNISRGGLVTAL